MCEGRFKNWFKVDRGLRQRCNMSPALFNLFINDLADTCIIHGIDSDIQCGGVQGPIILMYADDIVHLADSEEKRQEMLKATYTYFVTNGAYKLIIRNLQ